MTLAEALEARIAQRLARAPRAAAPPAADLAARVEATLRRYVEALVERRLRRAVLARPMLAERWPLAAGEAAAADPLGEALHALDRLDATDRRWPIEVALIDVVEALQRTGDPDARAVADALGENRPAVIDAAPPPGASADVGSDDARGAAYRRWPPFACALIRLAEQQVREDARRTLVPIAASHQARAALAVLSQGPQGPWVGQFVRGTSFELVWDGAPRRYQLAFHFREHFEAAVIKSILDELREDGLRDWLVLHRMAAAQGRSGAFVWTWREHRERTAYARRIAQDNLSDGAAAAAVTARLWRFKRAEVRQYITRADGVKAWARIGQFGFIDIPAAVTLPDGASLDRAKVEINPALYDGARRDAERPCFALIPDEALTLEGPRLRLATMLALSMRYARADGGVVVRTAGTLWEDLNTYKGQPARRDWARADAVVQRALAQLADAQVVGAWHRDPGPATPETRYVIHPALWWRDQVIYNVPPDLGPTRADLPHSGADLQRWRTVRRWSQAELANRLGVGIATIKRAELAPEKSLGPAIAVALERFEPERGT